MPSLQNPAALILLILVPLLFILRKIKLFKQISFPAVLSDWGGTAFTWNGKSHKVFSVISKIFLISGYLLVVLALSDPIISNQEKVYTSLGTDIIFVMDASPSMAATDLNEKSRIQAAKDTIKQLMTIQDGVRLGIVVLGSNASVFVPPTTDHAFIEKKLEEIQVGILGNGSAIGDGLSTAICHLVSSTAPKKCIVLLTDGENNSGAIHPETAATLAKVNNIPIYVVGIGTKGVFAIEYIDPTSGTTYSGRYNSDFDAESLRKIASLSNGRYFEAKTIEELINSINTVTKKENVVQNFTYKTVNQFIYDKFLFWGIVLIAFAWIIKCLFLHEVL